MKKYKLYSILLLTVTFIIYSCAKEGPQGPAGATGPQGPAGATGAQGPAGTANVVYSSWYTTTAADWGSYDYTAPYWDINYYIQTAPGITQTIIDNGIVLCFMKNWVYDSDGYRTPARNTDAVQLPFTADTYWMDSYDFALPAPGSIRFMYKNSLLVTTSPWLATDLAGTNLRYIIIPGSVLGGRGVNSADQLKSMSYHEICSLFNIPE